MITNTNSITKYIKDNVMFYLEPAPIMHPHIVEEFYDEDQEQWGQFVDIDPTDPVVPSNAGCYTSRTNHKKRRPWSPSCDTIKETQEEMHEQVESWHTEYYNDPPRSTICSHFEFLGNIALSLLHVVTFIDKPATLTSTVEPLLL